MLLARAAGRAGLVSPPQLRRASYAYVTIHHSRGGEGVYYISHSPVILEKINFYRVSSSGKLIDTMANVAKSQIDITPVLPQCDGLQATVTIHPSCILTLDCPA